MWWSQGSQIPCNELPGSEERKTQSRTEMQGQMGEALSPSLTPIAYQHQKPSSGVGHSLSKTAQQSSMPGSQDFSRGPSSQSPWSPCNSAEPPRCRRRGYGEHTGRTSLRLAAGDSPPQGMDVASKAAPPWHGQKSGRLERAELKLEREHGLLLAQRRTGKRMGTGPSAGSGAVLEPMWRCKRPALQNAQTG